MAGLLVFSSIEEESSLRQCAWVAVLTGLAFASSAGLSVYVTFTFAIFAVIWALQLLFEKSIKTLITFVAAGAISLLLSWPYLLDLLSKRNATASTAGGDRFVFFAFRDFPIALQLLQRFGVHNSLVLKLSQLPTFLLVYILEFGFFALIFVLCLRRDWRSRASLSRQRRMMWLMFVVCLVTMSIVQSDSTGTNDLGFRGILIAQFVLLVWSAPIVYGVLFSDNWAEEAGLGAPWIKLSIILTLAIGAAGTGYQLVILRCYAPLVDAKKIVRSETFLGSPGFAERTFWLREGFGRLEGLTGATTAVQYNPVRDETLMVHLYSTRQAVMGDEGCGSPFGGDLENCRLVYPYVAALFNSPDAVRGWDLNNLCDELHVNVLVATDADPVWQDRYGWVWTRPTLLSNPSMRAVPCGMALPSPVAQ
jgi:hypothetical protein